MEAKVGKLSTVLILAVSLLACSVNNGDNAGDTTVVDEITDLETLKQVLTSVKTNNERVLSWEEEVVSDKQLFRFAILDKDTIYVDATLINEVTMESGEWVILVTYRDDTSITLDSVDNTILRDGAYELTLNPSGKAPLTALLDIDTPIPGRFSITVLGRGAAGISIGHAFETISDTHALPVLGLYQNHTNQVKVDFYSESGQLLTTDTLSIRVDQVMSIDMDINVNNLPMSDQKLFFITDLKAGFDHRGQVRWAWTHGAHYVYRKLANGNLIISSNEDQVMYHTRRFYEVDMLGNILATFETPNYQHHEIRELPNGNMLVAENMTPIVRGNGMNQEDTVREYERETQQEVKVWDFSTILDRNRPTIPGERAEDWLHMNAIWYDEPNDAIIVSGRAQCAVASVDYDTGDLNWIISNPNEWPEEFEPYLFTPVDAAGQPLDVSEIDFWPYGQHTAMRLPNGNMLMYDNGRYRGFYDDPNVPASSYSRAVEYRIDTDNMTIELVWEFKVSESLFTPFTGDVDYDPETQHRMVGFMWGSDRTPRFFELDENNEVIYDAVINVGNNYYRVEKMDLYEGLD